MIPLRVEAELFGEVAAPDGIQLDALLAYAVALRDQMPPVVTRVEVEANPIEIPVQRSVCGRFHMSTSGLYAIEYRRTRYRQRRFPIEHAQALTMINRVNLAAGRQKNFRIPFESNGIVRDRIEWFAIGDLAGVQDLLALIHYLGRRRAVGSGKIKRWTVDGYDPSAWEGEFPIVRDGRALRPLPAGYAGVVEQRTRYGRLTYPYWARWDEQEVLYP